MQLSFKFFIDNLGFRRAEAEPSDGILGCHLTGDHMRTQGCDWTLQEIERIKENKEETHMGGNAAIAEINTEKVKVIPTWDGEPHFECELSLQEYQKLILAWRDFLISRQAQEISCEIISYSNPFAAR